MTVSIMVEGDNLDHRRLLKTVLVRGGFGTVGLAGPYEHSLHCKGRTRSCTYVQRSRDNAAHNTSCDFSSQGISGSPMRVLNYRFFDPAVEIIELLRKGYCSQLEVNRQSWHVHISPPGLLLWGDGDHVRLVYDFVVRRAVLEGAEGSEIALTVIERGNMDECSVWCSRWRINTELLETPCSCSVGVRQTSPHHDPLADMTVCRQIVEMHGGHMWIEAAPDSWAKVIFVLPKRGAGLS